MAESSKPQPTCDQVAAWLAERHGVVHDLEALSGGFWSSAFAYRADGEGFVLRLGHDRQGYEIDAAAARFTGPDLPVPEVLDIGEALGFQYAVSRRHHGRFVETIDDPGTAGTALSRVLRALRTNRGRPGDPVHWYDPTDRSSWHDVLRAGLRDRTDSKTHGWSARIAADGRLDALFQTIVERIERLLPGCPERRDLVHGDLLHQNVLVTEDARIGGVFSWKCSVLGDFLYDVAWCTLWSSWHQTIALADVWRRTLASGDLTRADLVDASTRHHCYELQIAASHFGWFAWTEDDENLRRLASVAESILERGPLPSR